jgi:PAS domain S-box-containing protein
MEFELWQLFLISVLYLGMLFIVASAAENRWLPQWLVNHPAVYALSLGVYATSWSYYGSVGLADREGFIFLAVYLGVTIAFVASPILLKPILRLIREYQLSSLADLLAFRYNSQTAGVLVTLFMLTGALPYMALQIQAVTDSLSVLTDETQGHLLALGFCLTITAFAILFGARHLTPREKHDGLVVAIAFESLVKLVALMVVGLYAVFGIFDGFSSFALWLENNPEATEALMQPIHDGPWGMMLLLSFSAAFLLPRQFHMIFVENNRPEHLDSASWTFPLFLLLLNLWIPPILWAGQLMDLSYGPDLYVLGVSMQSQSVIMPVFTFIGGISAASAMIIVTSIALASMCQTHLLLPVSFFNQRQRGVDLYGFLIWSKRLLIGLVILSGYAFYLFLQVHQELTDLGLIAFVAVAQFLPGIFGLLYWRRASRLGFISGLLAGATLWVLTLILPLFHSAGWLNGTLFERIMLPMSSTDSAFWTLLANSLLFVVVSIIKPQTQQEQDAANACCSERLYQANAIPSAMTLEQLESGLAETIGPDMASREISLALFDLGLDNDGLDRNQMARLRTQLQHNLSGLIGPVLADMVVSEQIQVDTTARVAIADTIQFVEKSLQGSRLELKELAGELDSLRRFHRQVLHDLPLAVVTISNDQQVLSWNRAMQRLSGLDEAQVLGQQLSALAEPWRDLLGDFLDSELPVLRSEKVRINDEASILNLFKSDVSGFSEADHHGFVVVVEDHSEIHKLESELAHSERLASIGRLATGVAHEIGNPVTGIACLAQDVQSMPDDRQLQNDSIRDILKLTDRISTIVRSLVSYSHAGRSLDHDPERIPVHQLIEESIRLVSLSHRGKQIDYVNNCADDIETMGDDQKLLQVLVILLTNACDASEIGGRIEIDAFEQGDQLSIIVKDHGSGIDDKIIGKIFDPFFTTKRTGEGTGLGLSLAYNIVQEHDGQIELNTRAGEGAEFIVRLPAARTRRTQHA